MNERRTTDLAALLAEQTNLDKKRAEMFLLTLSSYITKGIEQKKTLKVLGLGTFKIVLVRERESMHIQTGERFKIPAHHKLSFIPENSFKEHLNRSYANPESDVIPSMQTNLGVPYEYEDEWLQELTVVDESDIYSIPEWDETILDVDKMEVNKKTNEITTSANEDDSIEDASIETDSIEDDAIDADSTETDSTETDSTEADDESESFVSEDTEDTAENEEEAVVSETANSTEQPELQDPEVALDDIYAFDDAYYYHQIAKTKKHNPEYAARLVAIAERTAAIADETKAVSGRYASTSNASQKRKPLAIPLWLWFILTPILIVAGISVGTYLFLHWYTDDGGNRAQKIDADFNQSAPFAFVDTTYVDMVPFDETNDIDSTNFADAATTNENTDSSDPVSTKPQTTTTSGKTEKKTTIDWLSAPTAEKNKHEPKRVNAQTARASSRTSERPKTNTTTTSNKKTLPASIRVAAGSNLYRIAEEYYGNIYFWVYIYEHNKRRIPNYRRISVGTEIYLPAPNLYGIDAKNASSVQKAKQKHNEITRQEQWDDYR